MTDPNDEKAALSERIEIGGLGGSLSVAALRTLLDPARREAALVEVDLSHLSVSVPAAALAELLARLIPGGDAAIGEDVVTIRPGGGAPGVRVHIPATGVRVRIDADGLRIDSE